MNEQRIGTHFLRTTKNIFLFFFTTTTTTISFIVEVRVYVVAIDTVQVYFGTFPKKWNMPRHRVPINLIYEYTILLIYHGFWFPSLVPSVMHNAHFYFHDTHVQCVCVRATHYYDAEIPTYPYCVLWFLNVYVCCGAVVLHFSKSLSTTWSHSTGKTFQTLFYALSILLLSIRIEIPFMCLFSKRKKEKKIELHSVIECTRLQASKNFLLWHNEQASEA